MARLQSVLLVLVPCLLLGCAGQYVKVAPAMKEPRTEVGPTMGSACGFLLFDFIPLGVNDRTERAYDSALSRVQATALINTFVIDRWYYAVVGVVHCTDVHGIAVR